MTDTFYTLRADGRSMSEFSGKTVIALGSFDGVHAAHRKLLSEAIALGKKLGAEVGVWCFSTLPINSLRQEKVPMITSLEEKVEILLSLGLDFVAVGDFGALCANSPEDFIENILKKELNCVGCVCGFNHRFGKGGKGNHETLKIAFGEERTVIIPEFTMDSKTVSSSAIRELIINGDLVGAEKMLVRPHFLKSQVVDGKRLGRKLGFPTANQYFPEGIIVPARGIYATVCTMKDGKKYVGISNVGIRPTVTDGSDSHRVNCETYVHDFSGDIYGDEMKVEFYKYLRAEKKFDSVEDLKSQIALDLESALEFFNNSKALIK